MKRTMIALFALALAFVFAGSAMAYNAKMKAKCGTGFDNHLLTFPYMPGAVDGWWQVFSVTNKGGAINYADLCMVGVTVGDLVDEDGDPRIFKLDEAVQYEFPATGSIPANGIIAGALTPTAPGIYALYGKTGTASANVKGFAMFGNTMAHGYFALNNATVVDTNGTGGGVTATIFPDVQGSSFLEFDYYPNMIDPWATGMAVTHNSTAPVTLTFTFHYATGTQIQAEKVLAKESMVVGSMSDLFEEVGTNTRARVRVTHNATVDGSGDREDVALQGFMFFGDGTHGMGYLGNPMEVFNGTEGVFTFPEVTEYK